MIITPLFDPKNAQNDEKINYLIQQNFIGNQNAEIPENLQEFISYGNVVDILDFSSTDFNKEFSLTPKKDTSIETQWEDVKLKSFMKIFTNISENARKDIENNFKDAQSKATKVLRLSNSDIFEITIGKRVLTKDIEETVKGIPVYSANVFEPFGIINKELLKEFDSSSVLWGIDGDWMVNYIAKNKPFYPTDHCGVIRVKGNEIHPHYLTWILEQAGKEVRFSRSYRASITRIKELKIKVPPISLQEKIVKKFEKLESQIIEAKRLI